jgi:hypothetical protein
VLRTAQTHCEGAMERSRRLGRRSVCGISAPRAVIADSARMVHLAGVFVSPSLIQAVFVNMRRLFPSQLPVALLLLIAIEASSSSVQAERWAKKPDGGWYAVEEEREQPAVFEADTKVRLFGVTLLGGIPDGIARSIRPPTCCISTSPSPACSRSACARERPSIHSTG